MNQRLVKLIKDKGNELSDGCMLDCYNQNIYQDTCISITTRIDACNHYFVCEEYMTDKNIKVESKHNPQVIQVGNIVDDSNIGFKNPQRGRVYSPNGVSPALNCQGGGGRETKIVEPMCSVHPISHKAEFNVNTSIKNISPALRATDYKCPHVVYEPTIAAMRGRNPHNSSERGKSNGTYQQRLEMNAHGTCNTLTGVQKDNLVVEPNNTPSFRIRKLTPREGFRLMGVDDEDIDKIQATGLSNSAQYKLGGNSIVVDVLYHLFRKMFVETENENQQLTFF